MSRKKIDITLHNFLILCTLFLLGHSTSYSQRQMDSVETYVDLDTVSISPTLPTVVGTFVMVDLESKEERSTIYNITLKSLTDNSFSQNIVDTAFDMPLFFRSHKFIDINHDGFGDLALNSSVDMKGQPGYHFWIYNYRKGCFEFSTELSEHISGYFSVEEDGTITSSARVGCGGNCLSSETYRIDGGHLILIEEQWDDEVQVNGRFVIRTITKRLINNQMTPVDTTFRDD